MIQKLTFLLWRDVGRQNARPMAEPMRRVGPTKRVVAVGLAGVLGDLPVHDVV